VKRIQQRQDWEVKKLMCTFEFKSSTCHSSPALTHSISNHHTCHPSHTHHHLTWVGAAGAPLTSRRHCRI
jgi:hypothetical protein